MTRERARPFPNRACMRHSYRAMSGRLNSWLFSLIHQYRLGLVVADQQWQLVLGAKCGSRSAVYRRGVA